MKSKNYFPSIVKLFFIFIFLFFSQLIIKKPLFAREINCCDNTLTDNLEGTNENSLGCNSQERINFQFGCSSTEQPYLVCDNQTSCDEYNNTNNITNVSENETSPEDNKTVMDGGTKGSSCYQCETGYNYIYDGESQKGTCKSLVPGLGFGYFYMTPTYLDNCSGDLICYAKTGTCEDPDNLPTQLKTLTQPDTCVFGESEWIDPLQTSLGKKTNGIQTAIGCVPTEPADFISAFLNWAIGIAGGIAFLFMLFGAFQILLSSGNPEKVKAGQEQLTSAIIGLLFVIFSVFILRIIGQPIMFISG